MTCRYDGEAERSRPNPTPGESADSILDMNAGELDGLLHRAERRPVGSSSPGHWGPLHTMAPPRRQAHDDESPRLEPIAATPAYKWGVTFSGNNVGLSLGAFLERVDELKIARGVSDLALGRSAVDLLDGPALLWYRANRASFGSWSEIVAGLKREFRPSDYNFRVLDEIRTQTQGPDEPMSRYVARMKVYFSRMDPRPSEGEMLHLIVRNIAPFYRERLGIAPITSVSQLLESSRALEELRESVQNYRPPAPPAVGRLLEPDLAYHSPQPTPRPPRTRDARICAATARPTTVCWQCGETGHRYSDCAKPATRRFCYGCGRPDVYKSSCPRCNASRRLNSQDGARTAPA